MGLLLLAAFGLHAAFADTPYWPGIVGSGSFLGMALLLLALCLGKEFHFWSIDGEKLDKTAKVWIFLTMVAGIAGAIVAHWRA